MEHSQFNTANANPISRVPFTRLRKGIKSKAEANRIYAALVLQVDELLKRQVILTWPVLLKSRSRYYQSYPS